MVSCVRRPCGVRILTEFLLSTSSLGCYVSAQNKCVSVPLYDNEICTEILRKDASNGTDIAILSYFCKWRRKSGFGSLRVPG